MIESSTTLTPPKSPGAMFLALSVLALQAFGGALAFAQDMMCERRRWLSSAQFLELVSIAQLMPGPNMGNLALLVGDHFFGWRGALASIAGLLTGPITLALIVASLFGNMLDAPRVAGALAGISAVAAGLIIGQGLRLAAALSHSPLGAPLAYGLALAAFLAAALWHIPLFIVIPALGGLGWGYALIALRRQGASRPSPP